MRFLTTFWDSLVETFHLVSGTWGTITFHSVAGTFAVISIALGVVHLIARFTRQAAALAEGTPRSGARIIGRYSWTANSGNRHTELTFDNGVTYDVARIVNPVGEVALVAIRYDGTASGTVHYFGGLTAVGAQR